ncbi:MAG: hypothetical protein CVU06_07815 [Bacteroidetes bacterium HGW-Bacteroidetes-22]|nr:MAG: hypothetical protein CVU06_07815 [Bacteroidetes bacterium HGW-Bacteroidetes-22]
MRITFLKLNKPRHYDYKPVFYDPKKEEMEERLREMGARETSTATIREKIRTKWHADADTAKKQKSRSGMMIYLLIVLMLLYIIFLT